LDIGIIFNIWYNFLIVGKVFLQVLLRRFIYEGKGLREILENSGSVRIALDKEIY